MHPNIIVIITNIKATKSNQFLVPFNYMIINLEYNIDIYLGKDTIVAYTWKEDRTCKYLEVNEIVESAEFRNWTSTKGKSITESNLVFSPPQVAEHCHVELKDQEISQETKERFEIPKSFSVSSQDIGHTNLVTMHVDTGDNPHMSKTLHIASQELQLGSARNQDIVACGSHQEEHQPLGQPQ